MLNRFGLTVFAIALLTRYTTAAPIEIFPNAVHLRHADDRQQLLAVEMDVDRSVADWTREAKFIVDNPSVAHRQDGGSL